MYFCKPTYIPVNMSDYIKDEIGTLKELHQFGADNDGSVCSFELCRWNT